MRIDTITCHDCYNFGASLQAFALQNYLESQGHNVRIIDYKPDYFSQHFKLSIIANPIYDRPLIRQLYLIAKLPGRILALKQKKVFDAFTSQYLKLTKRYNSYEELKSDAPEADIYIAGSDQIWNTLFNNGRDPAFYLDFGQSSTKRISYAASFATKDIAPTYKEFVSQELTNFDAVSIREKISLPLLRELGRKDGVSVCDPVFLLSEKEWSQISQRGKSINLTKDYILVYLTDKSDTIMDIAWKLSRDTGWEIIILGPASKRYKHRCIRNIGPLEFVFLISKANFVISNSFHATAFSLIFKKNFCVVNRTESINERMISILDEFGLSHRIVSGYNPVILKDIDYSTIISRLDSLIVKSKEWLNYEISERQ